MPSRIRLILNGKSQLDVNRDQQVRAAVVAARAGGCDMDVRVTWESGHAAQFAREAATSGFDTVIAGGGDGTLNEVVEGLLEAPQGCSLAVLPLGTANDFATGAGIPSDDVFAALQLAIDVEPVLIDVGSVAGRPFINVASGGVGAEITSETSEEIKRLLGGLAYFVTGVASAGSIAPRWAAIRAPDFEWSGNVIALTAANGTQAGGGFKVGPEARLNDRLLDIMVIPEHTPDLILPVLHELMEDPATVQREHVIYKQVPWLEVEVPSGFQVNVDGEPISGESFRFEILKRQVPFHLPAGYTADCAD